MDTASSRRKRKLEVLIEKYGLAKVADKAEVNPAALEQILKGVLLPAKADGTRSPRALGNRAARTIEKAFRLGVGWFDQPFEPPPFDDDTLAFAVQFQQMQPYQRALLRRLYETVVKNTPPPQINPADFQGGLDTGYGAEELKPTTRERTRSERASNKADTAIASNGPVC